MEFQPPPPDSYQSTHCCIHTPRPERSDVTVQIFLGLVFGKHPAKQISPSPCCQLLMTSHSQQASHISDLWDQPMWCRLGFWKLGRSYWESIPCQKLLRIFIKLSQLQKAETH